MPVDSTLIEYLHPAEVKRLLARKSEIAFLDVREHGQYGEGHPFLAVPAPYSRLELVAPTLVPRKGTPIVVLDEGDGVAARAARRLAELDYTDVRGVEGGAPGWSAAGFTLYRGVNVPSKTLGELVEERFHTPRIAASALHGMKAAGKRVLQLDGRPVSEYRRMTVPGAICCPNAELGHRLPALVADETVPIVVNCAGRTRSIIGAQSLINLGLPNPVFALENGTQGWALGGLELERGASRLYPQDLDDGVQAVSVARGRDLRERFGVPLIDAETLDAWAANSDRTLYCFDVRTGEEFAAKRHPLARHAPGGQLVQATDQWVAVRGARIVLFDDTGLRASNTAVWLRAMGHEAYVFDPDADRNNWEAADGVENRPVREALPECRPEDLARLLDAGAVHVLDLNPSSEYRREHIVGSRWSIRPRLASLDLDPSRGVVLVCANPDIAAMAAVDLRELGHRDLRRLGGNRADQDAAGLQFEAGTCEPGDADAIDFLFFVHDRHDGNLQAARDYLEWEQGLVAQLDRDERAVFRL